MFSAAPSQCPECGDTRTIHKPSGAKRHADRWFLTQAYRQEHFHGANYADLTESFEQSRRWPPNVWAQVFRDAGAGCVVPTTKHHGDFGLWQTNVATQNQKNPSAQRDIVGDLTESVRKAGLKIEFYYSGGYDWAFDRGPIEQHAEYETVKPESVACVICADAQLKELIALLFRSSPNTRSSTISARRGRRSVAFMGSVVYIGYAKEPYPTKRGCSCRRSCKS
jgi:alpha-L-fucosidase